MLPASVAVPAIDRPVFGRFEWDGRGLAALGANDGVRLAPVAAISAISAATASAMEAAPAATTAVSTMATAVSAASPAAAATTAALGFALVAADAAALRLVGETTFRVTRLVLG